MRFVRIRSNLGRGRLRCPDRGPAAGRHTNPEGSFALFRIGDALFSRNIHAAIYDAGRLMKHL